MTKAETDLTEQHCSNRLHCSRNSKSLGIDRLTLWFPTRPGGWFNRDADDLTANLHIMSRGNRAGVDFNPSRVVDPYGTGLASTENAIEVTGEVWRVVSGHVVPRVTLALAHVTRLDVAHDFLGAMEPSQLILGLSKLRRPYQGDPGVRFDGHTGEAVSVVVGSSEKQVRIYRKDVESDGLASEGLIRWECQVRSRPLRTKFGITTFSDIDPESITALAESRWAWSKMGTPVRTARDAFDVVNGLEETASIKAKCYWDLMGIARYGTWPSSDHSRRRLCRLIAERGIVVADGCISVPSEPTLVERLDWTKGTVISTYGLADGNSAASSSPAKGGTDD